MELLNKLAENGILAIVLAISLYANYLLAKKLLEEKDKRIAGAELIRDNIAEPMKNLERTTGLIYEKISISKENSK